MINTLGQRHQVTLLDVDADPIVVRITNVKKSTSVQNVTNLFSIVDVLFKEGLDLVIISGQKIGTNGNNIGVRISA